MTDNQLVEDATIVGESAPGAIPKEKHQALLQALGYGPEHHVGSVDIQGDGDGPTLLSVLCVYRTDEVTDYKPMADHPGLLVGEETIRTRINMGTEPPADVWLVRYGIHRHLSPLEVDIVMSMVTPQPTERTYEP